MDAARNETAIELFESMLEKPVPEPIATRLRRKTNELNLVRSGLDDTMRRAYGEIRDLWRSRDDVPDLRTAAMMLAIERIARYYTEYALL